MCAPLMHSAHPQRMKHFTLFFLSLWNSSSERTLQLTFRDDHRMLFVHLLHSVFTIFDIQKAEQVKDNMSISDRRCDMKVFCWHFCQLLEISDGGFMCVLLLCGGIGFLILSFRYLLLQRDVTKLRNQSSVSEGSTFLSAHQCSGSFYLAKNYI